MAAALHNQVARTSVIGEAITPDMKRKFRTIEKSIKAEHLQRGQRLIAHEGFTHLIDGLEWDDKNQVISVIVEGQRWKYRYWNIVSIQIQEEEDTSERNAL
ncbi:hypothetical protein ACIP6T_04805 [Pantoea sp. NPDC088449]|uniref:hypothetical protein n=1 Tax=Pantoea sp. NPDC088449 TaxID=3364392 RepID=UPI0037FD37B4